MPIYEFYCPDCNTIFNFFSKRVNTQKIPSCPRCRRQELIRQMSIFRRGGNLKDTEGNPYPDLDEARFERAMDMLAREAQALDENDPRQAAILMRKVSQMAGLELGPKMEEALTRMERGEDMDAIEEEMKDAFESEEDLFQFKERASSALRKKRPLVDETLYDL
ncbi:MAG: FmdB family zinc ribbon protein [Desulfatiglandales bacterium]